MNTFDELEEAVAPVDRGRKQKRQQDDTKRGKAKKLRHGGASVVPCVSCTHTKATSCKAATISREEIISMKERMYSTTNKEKQDSFLLSYMDITSAHRRRVQKTENGKHKNRNVSVKYNVLNDKQEKIIVCKKAFMSILG